MKKAPKKLILLIICSLLILTSILFLIPKTKKTSKEDLNTITKIYENYIHSLTLGYPSNYNGIDILYNEDSFTYDSLDHNAKLNIAARYTIAELNNNIPEKTKNKIKDTYGYDLNNYFLYDGNSIKKAIKDLFNKNFEHGSKDNNNIYGYDFIYIASENIYLKTKGPAYASSDGTQYIEYKVLDSKTKKDNIYLDVAIAYINCSEKDITYSNKKDNSNIIYKTTQDKLGIQEKYIKQFPKYRITFIKDKNNIYFNNIKKIK